MERAQVEELAATHQASLLRLATLLTGDPQRAEDLVQQCYVKLLRSRTQARYPVAVARKTIVNLARTPVASERTTVMEVPEPREFEGTLAERDAVWAQLQELSPRQRAVLVLRYYEDLHDDEIARTLGCRRATVRSLAMRGLAKVRKSIESAQTVTGGEPHGAR